MHGYSRQVDEFQGTERFELVARLGEGGMGVVYEALDRERDARVAIKTIRHSSPDHLVRFKNEFRAVQDVHHPNLVRLGELIDHHGTLFYTMELVEGVPFVDYLRGRASASVGAYADTKPEVAPHAAALLGADRAPNGSLDVARVRDAFGQLVAAIAELHAAGMIHRDIKPSNVLVTEAGRVVVLDFGLVTEMFAFNARHTSPGELVGTAAYMSPEQAAGHRVGPEADVYAAGAVLYESLTDALPFEGTAFEVIMRKQQFLPPAPSTRAAGIPEDLEALCMRMMRTLPSERPTPEQVLRELGVDVPESARAASLHTSSHGGELIGRDAEMRQLDDAWLRAQRGRAVSCAVYGGAGTGKTALVRGFLDGLPRDVTVLQSRCYERESTPFKGIDGIVDALARHLAAMPSSEVVELLAPSSLYLASRVFPVLRRLQVRTELAPTHRGHADPREQRARAFGALRQMFRRLARGRPLVVVIEDMQWADADSVALLRELLREPDAPALLLLGTIRTESGVDVVRQTERFAGVVRGDVRLVRLEPLAPHHAANMAAQLLEKIGTRVPGDAAAIATESGGHPLFIHELVRYSAHAAPASNRYPRLHDAIWTRVPDRDSRARRLLELIAVAGAPVPLITAADAIEASLDEVIQAASALRAHHLARTSGARSLDRIEVYHDRVRDAVLARVPWHERKSWHQRIALAMEATNANDPETVSSHYHQALLVDKAAEYALLAAQQAGETLAFDRAARLYNRTIQLSEHARAHGRELPPQLAHEGLLIALGWAYANAGDGARAAETFLDASRFAEGGDRLELRRLAAQNLLESGHIDRGLDELSKALSLAGEQIPATGRRALASLGLRRLQLRLRGMKFKRRHASEVASTTLTQLDLFATGGRTIGLIDFVLGAYLQTRQTLLALQTGDPARVALALCMEAAYRAASGARGRRRALPLLQRAAELAETIDEPTVESMIQGTHALIALQGGRFAECLEICRAGEELLRTRCVHAYWQLSMSQLVSAQALAWLGKLGDLRAQLSGALADAVDRDNVTTLTNLRSGWLNLAWLAEDDPVTARLQADDAIRRWSGRSFLVQHAFDLIAQAHISLYVGEVEAAHERLEEAWARAQDSLLLRVEYFELTLRDVRGRVAVAAAAAATGKPRMALLRTARAEAAHLRREGSAWTGAMADVILAAAHRVDGDDELAADRLAAAITGFGECNMELHQNLARWQLARLTGEAERLELPQQYMDREGIVAPDRLARTLVPMPATVSAP